MRITENGTMSLGVFTPAMILHVSDNLGGGTAKLVFWDNDEKGWVDFGEDTFSFTSLPINKRVVGNRLYGLEISGAISPNILVNTVQGI